MGAVETYLDRLAAHDWDGLAATLAEQDFERIGPFADLVSSKGAYVKFLAGIVPQLERYRLKVRRIVQAGDVVMAEINEVFEFDGQTMDYPEALVFDLDGAGLIRRVQVYMMRPGEQPPVPGGSAASS